MVKKATAPAKERNTRKATAPAGAVADFAPVDILLPYQKQFALDPARFIAGCFSRQTGKSFSAAYRFARLMVAIPRTTCMIAAPSARQSAESLDKVKDWLSALSVAYAEEVDTLKDVEDGFTAKVVKLRNGSRCIAVPGRPDTVRGFSGHVWLDEFAFFDEPDATWKAILPTILNSLRGGKKTVCVTSTPNGKGGKGARFYKIMEGDTRATWSRHTVPLKSAIADGLPVDYDEMAALMDDPIAQAQELDCEFLDDSNELLPYDLIAAATSPDATAAAPLGLYDIGSGRDLRLGIDFGRTNDPTVCWCLERVGDVWITREVLVIKNCPADVQERLLAPRIAAAARTCFDYTGPGIGTGDHLVSAFGRYKPESHEFGKVELCTFTLPFKRDIFPKLRRAFEAPVTVRIPAGDDIRDDLHAMNQIISNGEYTYSAPRTAAGHSDRCTALALAFRAASGATLPTLPVPLTRGSALPAPIASAMLNRPF